ncbi:TD and POZ domain-containing protein 3-like [Formica exsecta]|uniref:TD and POZ domain-containing protein 3-like n=1 Tax=Formica exsecta TaxID=72781 RepID=UPI0011434311|nr:TD and POZ domain-containing protein 3-like [Formica exsecta]XP_029659338.1 TD and POZ domain-containing protein 3-like [Formica exsecta]XP_029659339.1 TD and POZ domain-containing protein 3-like [Formica exsecta]XP_029659340.1 TD and POZ domain-containing protein 3-like [Formica exsecta]
MIKMMSTIDKDEIYHCKTQLKQNRLCYTWNISDIWEIYKFGIKLCSLKTINHFTFEMHPAEDKLNFYCIPPLSCSSYNISFSVFLKTNTGEMTNVLKLTYINLIYDSKIYSKYKNTLFYKLPISLLSDKHMFLSNNTLTICFKLYIFINTYSNSVYYSYERSAMTDTDIFVPKEKSDSFVSFIINNERLEANKKSLCLKSKVFEAMFNCGLKESENKEVVITDIRYDILKELLFFVQIGYLSKTLEEIEEINTIRELFVAADKYDIQDLKLICEQYLIINTTEKNVVEHLKIAHLNNGKTLEEYTKDFIQLYSKDIVDTSELTLMKMYPELLTQTEDIEQIVQNVEVSAKSV